MGAGNVATVLGRLLLQNGHTIEQVIARNAAQAGELALRLGAMQGGFEGLNNEKSDVILLTTSDDTYPTAYLDINLKQKIIVHTAGSVSVKAIEHMSENTGVLYPLQTLNKSIEEIPEIPLLITANNDTTLSVLAKLAYSISPSVKLVSDHERLLYHTSAVFTSNFVNHLYALGNHICTTNQLDADLLKPLIAQTARKALNGQAAQLQTGPAVRGDIATINKHLRVLKPMPRLRSLYMRLSDSIIDFKNS